MKHLNLGLAIAILMITQFNCLNCNGRETSSDTTNAQAAGDKGPTIFLYEKKENPLADFMYFVPLISPVSVTNETSKNNRQKGYIILCTRNQEKNDSFLKSCEFRMKGEGFHINNFDHEQMIERNQKGLKKGRPIKNILDYIKFKGEGYGRIDIRGTVNNKVRTVTKVDVYFNARGNKSPVYVGLYSVQPKNGKYEYANKYDTKVARVNMLGFTRSQKAPKMQIKVDAVGSSEESLGIIAGITGSIANLLISPLEITKIGNDEMLSLGLAIYNKKETFTFPKAENLKMADKAESKQ